MSAPILVLLFALLYQYADTSDVAAMTYECTSSFSDSGITDFVYLPRMLNQSGRFLGVVGPPKVRAEFIAYLEKWYPGMSASELAPFNCIGLNLDSQFSSAPAFFPGFGGYLKEFDDEASMEAYVLDDRYGQDEMHKGLHQAVVFSESAPLSTGNGSWSYRLRSNITDIPDVTKLGDALQNGPNFGVIEQYFSSLLSIPGQNDLVKATAPGLIPLQLAVDRFILGSRVGSPNGKNNSADALAFSLMWNCSSLTDFSAPLRFLASQTLLPQRVRVAPFPTFPYRFTSFYALVGAVFPLMFTMAFLFPAFFMIRAVVQEKEMKLREGMKMMGMNDAALTAAWFAVYALQFFFIALLVTWIVKATFFYHTDGGVLFVLFFSVGLASTALCFLISVFFSRSKMASFVGTMMFLALFFPYFKVNDPTSKLKGLGSLSHSVAFGLALDIITTMESSNQTLNWSNITNSVNGFSMASAIAAILGDTLLYTLLSLYASQVFPQEFGVPLPWHFPLNPAHWAPNRYGPPGRSLVEAWGAVFFGGFPMGAAGKAGEAISSSLLLSGSNSTTTDGDFLSFNSEAPVLPAVGNNMEPPGHALVELGKAGRSVSLRGLRKVFGNTPDGAKAAVAGVDVDMYEGQIFALLGHNGAGKSTTISMITGLIPPTAGDAWAYGHSIRTDLSKLRQRMGVCPQHDVLWPDLTVKEHLVYFARMKGVPLDSVDSAVLGVIRDVGLTEKVDALSKDLSGGMKRKLSVGIALIGDPKVVFLDEPTSGMDPYSRRFTWNILQNARAGRVMVLTTHFMDEADILGDRIAIMADGQIRCCGSSMYLKKMFGVGYSLTVIKATADTSSTRGGGASCDVDALEKVIRASVPEASRVSNVGAEVSFQLPLSSSPAFPALFECFETRSAELGIQSYGVSVTTMEQVFVKVAEEGHEGDKASENNRSSGSLYAEGSSALAAESKARSDAAKSLALGVGGVEKDPQAEWNRETERGDAGFWRHFKALLNKRRLFAMRDKSALLCQLAIPFLAVLGGLLLLENVNANTPPTLKLSMSGFNGGFVGGGLAPPNVIPVAFSANSGTSAPFFVSYLSNSGRTPQNDFTSPASFNSTFIPVAGLDGEEFNATQYPLTGSDANCTLPRYQRLPPLILSTVDSLAEGPRMGPSSNPPLAEEYSMSRWLLSNASSTAAASVPGGVPLGVSLYTGVYLSELSGSLQGGNVFASYTALVNSTAWHITPTIISIVNSGLLNWVSSGSSNASISVEVQPLPFSNLQRNLLNTLSNFFAVLFIVIAFSFIPASFAVFVVKEREVSAKHQQLISGVSIPAYWLATYAWDCINYALPATVCFFLLLGFNQLVDGGRAPATALLFILFGTAVAPFTYILSFAFSSHSSAQIYLLLLNLACMILLLASFVMKAIPATCAWDARLRFLYRLLPTYALGNGLQQLSYFKQLVFTESQCGMLTPQEQFSQQFTPFSPAAAGWPLAYLAAETVIYTAITIGIDLLLSYPILRASLMPDKDNPADKIVSAAEEDGDVVEEARRVSGGEAEGDTIVVAGLRKVYGGAKTAVRNLHFGIPSGEVFGFLGINGAGKTTTLKILSGEDIPTAGTARLDGLDILREQIKVRRLLGYCPQFDSILELLTVREHLELYGRIKGVPEARLNAIVAAKIAEFDLVNYANKLAGSLSGGNKRKLSVAISMIGSPRLIFLDEPSTGMDPVARRFMWRVIASIATERKQCSIILTTHSMEEAEALCGRIGIMVGGRLRCLGSVQHLKRKFGQAYTALFKVEPPSEARIVKCLAYLKPFLTPSLSPAQLLLERGSKIGGRGYDSSSSSNNSYARIDNSEPLPQATSNKEELGSTSLDDMVLPLSRIQEACAALGDEERRLMIHKDASGWSIAAALTSDLCVNARAFSEWWTQETIAAVLHDFMKSTYPGCSLVERAGGDFLRYSIPSSGNTLSAVFRTLEDSKGKLGVVDYSLGETSLESIFNVMAVSVSGAGPLLCVCLCGSIPNGCFPLDSSFSRYTLTATKMHIKNHVPQANQDEEKGSVRGMGEKTTSSAPDTSALGSPTRANTEEERSRMVQLSLPRISNSRVPSGEGVASADNKKNGFPVRQLLLN